MPPDVAAFEKLGSFYLGKPVGEGSEDAPFLYDSRDLVTHAVCVGMTGSGKTGLCIALLEEAAIDGVPALIIDPKGDLTNLALQFPRLHAEDFRPWVAADEAARQGVDIDALAESQATLWREGLAKWWQDGARIQRLSDAAEMAIYTPGSPAGRPLSVLGPLAPPTAAVREDPELFGERIQSTAAALLGLVGIAGDAQTRREHTLISKILELAWAAGETLTLVELVRRIQKPPFASIGVLDLESFYPEAERFALMMAFNNLLASPGFSLWQEGEALDIQSLLFTPEGRPRLAVLSIAHLGEAQRMFFVSLVLNAAVSWMRGQSGTSSLRAILYMDEVFGYFPPVANPPSKRPILTLLKQARACGLGVVLATQNPADLDYKGLANAGTWFIGRLQTERDRARLLDGIGEAGATDRVELERLLAQTGSRRFVMHNVHESGPVLFESRWALSYLRGPLDREQIRSLSGAAPRAANSVAAGIEDGPPVLKDAVQLFATGVCSAVWTPRLLVSATMHVRDARRGVDRTIEDARLARIPGSGRFPDWADATEVKEGDFGEAIPEGRFEQLPEGLASGWESLRKDAVAWLAANCGVEVHRCAEMKMESRDGESARDFAARVALAVREVRDREVQRVRETFVKKIRALEMREQRAAAAVSREESQASQAKVQTALSVGSTLLGALFGRQIGAGTVGKATTAARGVGRSIKEAGDVATARENLGKLQAERTELETALSQEVAKVSKEVATFPAIEHVRLPPLKSSVRIRTFAIAWIPGA